MPNFDIVRQSKIKKTFRVASIFGKFDLQESHSIEHFKGEINLDKEWQIGVIYGRSGSGKTTIAKELFNDFLIKGFDYSTESVIDDFNAKLSVDEITSTFNSVGFSSPPSWVKPYSVLSNGEKMRVDLARAILENKEMIVFDEFTSVVDRNVAKIGSAAISKAIKRTNKKFIAVSCHGDIIEWLEPDWIFDCNSMTFRYARGSLCRPKITLEVRRIKGFWKYFRKYHYLNSELNNASEQFVGFYNGQPIAFSSYLHFPHPILKNTKIEHRTVCLPDFQGIGIGSKLSDFVGRFCNKNGFKFISVTSNPAMIRHREKSKSWKLNAFGRKTAGSKTGVMHKSSKETTSSYKRISCSWEFIEK